ncbi:MAG: GTP-binding protein [Pseudomonadota bacterium]
MNTNKRIPVTVLTGFLGAGKSTLLNRVLHDPVAKRALVIINEFGSIGVDHDLVAHADVESGVVELFNGCLCCTIRGDLSKTLKDARWRYSRGGERWFDRVIIETTGLADPAPIVQTFLADPAIAKRYALRQIVTVVDAVNGPGTLAAQPEAEKQVAVADAIVLTKADLASADQFAETQSRVRALNPAAPVHESLADAALAELLQGTATFNPDQKGASVQAWLAEEAHADHSHSHSHSHGHHHHHHHDGHGHDPNRHNSRIRSISMSFDTPRSARVFDAWFDHLARLRGSDLLRVKGILNVSELDVPMVIHGVQHIWHPPEILEAWPGEDRRSRVVFIVRDLEQSDLLEALSFVTSHVENAQLTGVSGEERAAVLDSA